MWLAEVVVMEMLLLEPLRLSTESFLYVELEKPVPRLPKAPLIELVTEAVLPEIVIVPPVPPAPPVPIRPFAPA